MSNSLYNTVEFRLNVDCIDLDRAETSKDFLTLVLIPLYGILVVHVKILSFTEVQRVG